MDAETPQDRQALLAHLSEAREKLDGFVHDLRAIDRELEDLATERKQHRLLHDACSALEELSEIGGAELFWDDRTVAATRVDQIRRVRSRIDVFEKRINEIEDRRQGVLEALEQQADATDEISLDVLEAEEEEERRQQEWIIERDISDLPARGLIMPWTRAGEEDHRYRRSLAVTLLYSLWFALVVPLIELPLREQEEPVAVPERVVRLMMEARALPPPPKRETRLEVPEESPLLAETPPKEAKKQKEGAGKGPGEGPGEGPAKGLLAFREKFARFASDQPLSRLGAQARITHAGPAPTGVVERSMITTLAPGSSGGINLAALSRGVNAGGSGGGEMASVQVARVASAIGGAGTGRAGGGGKGTGAGGGPALGRTDEEIQIVFDRYKSALYRLYNRELRNDPTLRGQVVLRMRIEPDGSVSLCELQGTDMRAPQLVAQVVERVKTFDFGAKDVAPVTILYPIDFLPAT